ncbi:MAG TPA: beta-L-arabinofuranosidase domain-containing protein [Naasia sp.]
MTKEFSRRGLLGMAAAAAAGAGIASVSPTRTTAAFATGLSGNVSDGAAGMNSYFPLHKVSLLAGPFKDNQTRNTTYLTFLDADRLLRNFRLTFGISTTATAPEGWEAPSSVLRGHTVGHWLSGLALTYANTGNTSCKAKGDYLVSALAACQARAVIQGFSAGYLSAYPESVFIDMENNLPATSNYAPYYVLHKIMQGLLDQYELAGNNQALSVLVGIADWVDYRTGNLTSTEMQQMLDTEYGGMSEVLANLGTITGASKYFNAANRWWHNRIMDPLAINSSPLDGEHANRQIPKFPGAIRLWEQWGTAKYFNTANNFWAIVLAHHTYAHGGNSDGEHFFEADAIATRLNDETSENCNSYNMLKLARLLLAIDRSRIDLLDYYERTLFNQMLGEQQPDSAHGYNHYFLGTRPGSIKEEYKRPFNVQQVSNGDYSSDYNNFTCDHGSGMETQAKFADTIYSYDASGMWVNLFIASEVNWTAKGLVLRQNTTFPDQNTTTITVVSGTAATKVRVRVPGWISAPISVSLNGAPHATSAPAGTWLEINRTWTAGDSLTLTFPMAIRTISANDIPHVKAIAYGPIVLAGQYGTTSNLPMPRINVASIAATATPLQFTAQADGQTVILKPIARTHKTRYTLYWLTAAAPPALRAWYKLDEAGGTGAADSSGAGLNATLVSGGSFVSGRAGRAVVLGGSGAHVRLPAGVVDNLQAFSISSWVRIDVDQTWQRVFDFGASTERCMYLTTKTGSNKLSFVYLATVESSTKSWVLEANTVSTNVWHHIAVTAGGGTARLWVDGVNVATNASFDRIPALMGSNVNSNYLGKSQYSDPTFRGAIDDFRIYSYALSPSEVGQLWGASFGAVTDVKMVVKHTGKVLGIAGMSTTDGANTLQWSDTGTDDHLWRLIDQGDGWYKIKNKNSGKVLGVGGMSTSVGGQVIQWSDTGTADHLWQIIPAGAGWFKIKNKNSGLLLSIDSAATTDGALAVQNADTGGDSKLWQLL